MSLQFQHQTFVRASARLLAIISFLGLMLVMNQTTASAQCIPNNCNSIRIFNCATPPIFYQARFILCCGGVTMFSPIIPVPPGSCAMPSLVYTAPAGCTVIGVAGVMPVPAGGWVFNPANCLFKIN